MIRALVALFLIFFATPCFATIGAPANLGSNNAAAGSVNLAITTGANCAANALILLDPAQNSSTGTISSASDSAGDSFSTTTAISNTGNNKFRLLYKQGALALSSGGTVTIVYSTSTVTQASDAACVTGTKTSTSLDVQGAGVAATGTNPSLSTGTLAQAYELLIGVITITAGTSDTYTEDTAHGWTAMTPVSQGSGSTGLEVRWAYNIVTTTSSVTWAPTLGTSRAYSANVYSFEGIGSPPGSCNGGLLLRGAGGC
jgi:hypothetical protein